MQEQSGVLGQPGRSRMKDPAKAAAGAAVDCAVICCCCPWGLANLLVLAVVKVPAHLCGGPSEMGGPRSTSTNRRIRGLLARERTWGTARSEASLEREEEIWKPFYGTGFWRTLSRQGSESSPIR
ncbi:unnamed protein product [Spirodela intermedia]|uniref:Uncharacterized protein n=1 Tax=Spirodela intermedia TaxID=51605 RepID=A0A7I8I833_SPIIN|nr:unnamed protein product [Spirodela intermedia]CAA6653749.1 unnamed protein product [Spirodela intermedia]